MIVGGSGKYLIIKMRNLKLKFSPSLTTPFSLTVLMFSKIKNLNTCNVRWLVYFVNANVDLRFNINRLKDTLYNFSSKFWIWMLNLVREIINSYEECN